MSGAHHIPAKPLIRLLATQAQKSGIEAVDILQYAVIAEWLCARYGNTKDWSIPIEALTWLQVESGFREDQRVKATYVANLLLDYHAGRSSAPCPEFQIRCHCGNLASRKDAKNHRYPMYRCSCGNAVGYHKGDGWPLGLLASKEVREWRGVLHATYDRLCQLWGVSPKKGYANLAALLDVPLYQCHFSLVIDSGRAQQINEIMFQEIERLSSCSGRNVQQQFTMQLMPA